MRYEHQEFLQDTNMPIHPMDDGHKNHVTKTIKFGIENMVLWLGTLFHQHSQLNMLLESQCFTYTSL